MIRSHILFSVTYAIIKRTTVDNNIVVSCGVMNSCALSHDFYIWCSYHCIVPRAIAHFKLLFFRCVRRNLQGN